MACTPDSIAAERLWAPLAWGSRHAAVGAPSSMPCNRNTPVRFCSSLSWGRSGRCGGRGDVGAYSQGVGFIPARSLTCHTVRHNRNVCVPLTLERRSVNALTCEFAHRIRGSRRPRRVLWGGKGGRRRARPSRSARPTGTTQPAREQPPDTDTTRGARNPGTPATTTRPNLNNQREQQPRPQVENNPTRTQPARQATHKTSPPPQKRTATHQTATSQRHPHPTEGRPEPRTTAHQAAGAGLKEGSQGNRPPRTTPPPRNRDPPTRHRLPPDTPTPEPNPAQKPDTRTSPPTTLQPPHHPHPTRYPAHMPWTTSNRRQRLPTNWNKIRKQVLAKANYKCQGLDPVATPPPTSRETAGGCHRWHHPACTMRATDVDHIIAGDNHELSNLQALSHACHTAKTTRENTAAKARMRATATREQPPHPCARATQTNKKEKQSKTKTKTNESKTQTETTRRETWN